MQRSNYLIREIELLKHNTEYNLAHIQAKTKELKGKHISFLTSTKMYGGVRVVGEIIRPIYDALTQTILLGIKEADTDIRCVYDVNYIRIFNVYDPNIVDAESLDEYKWELEFYRKRVIGQQKPSPANIKGQQKCLTEYIRKALDVGHLTNKEIIQYLDAHNIQYKRASVHRISSRERKKIGLTPQSKRKDA